MDIVATLTEDEATAAVAGGVVGATISMIAITGFIWYILTVIATWKIFKKAGEAGWKCLIPIYNTYIMYKIVGMKTWFWIMLAICIAFGIITIIDGTTEIFNMTKEQLANFDWGSHIPTVVAMIVTVVVAIVVGVANDWRTSKIFGHGVGYFIGLLFFQPIFWLIIGFGSSKYDKKLLKEWEK